MIASQFSRCTGTATILLHSPAMDEQSDYTNKLWFLTTSSPTCRAPSAFSTTKAAFCVTLLTAMAAAAFQLSSSHHRFPQAHLVFLGAFALLALACLSVCVRVIFPPYIFKARSRRLVRASHLSFWCPRVSATGFATPSATSLPRAGDHPRNISCHHDGGQGRRSCPLDVRRGSHHFLLTPGQIRSFTSRDSGSLDDRLGFLFSAGI